MTSPNVRIMETLLPHVPFEQYSLDSLDVENFLENLRKRRFTGAVWLQSATNASAAILFIDGLLLEEFFCPLGTPPCRPTSLENILSQFRLGHVAVLVQHLPVEALQAVRLMLNAAQEHEDTLSEPAALDAMIQTYIETEGSTVLRLSWSDSDACIVVTGGHPAPLTIVLWTPGASLTGDEALPAIRNKVSGEAATLVVFRVQQVNQQEHEQTHSLHTAFTALFNQMLFLYKDFVGQHLTARLTRHLNRLIVSKYGWDIRISTNGIEGGSNFAIVEEARIAYEQIINDFIHLAGIVVGPQLAQLLVRESFQLLPRDLRDTLNAYNLPPFETQW